MYVFFKRVEFPIENFSDIVLDYCDNGDHTIEVRVGSNAGKIFTSACRHFVPTFDRCRFILGGVGNSVLLKEVKATYVPRCLDNT